MKTMTEIGNEILALPQEPMSEDTSKIFLSCMFGKHAKQEVPEGVVASFPYQVMLKRCELNGIEVNPWVLAFLTTITDRVGVAVLYVAALKAIHHKIGREIGFEELAALDAFGTGFPTEEGLHTVWKNQKIHHRESGTMDNMLDLEQPTEKRNADHLN